MSELASSRPLGSCPRRSARPDTSTRFARSRSSSGGCPPTSSGCGRSRSDRRCRRSPSTGRVAKAIPLARRPWQLLLVPPTPGAPTRGFNVARWQARLVLGLAAALLVVAGAGVSAVVIAVRSPDLFATSAEAAMLRARLTVVEDSLALARSELEAPDDTLAAAVLGGALRRPTSAAAAARASEARDARAQAARAPRDAKRRRRTTTAELTDGRHRGLARDRRDRESLLARAPASAAAHRATASRCRRRGTSRHADHRTRRRSS